MWLSTRVSKAAKIEPRSHRLLVVVVMVDGVWVAVTVAVATGIVYPSKEEQYGCSDE